jgi:hypothetical protein
MERAFKITHVCVPPKEGPYTSLAGGEGADVSGEGRGSAIPV